MLVYLIKWPLSLCEETVKVFKALQDYLTAIFTLKRDQDRGGVTVVFPTGQRQEAKAKHNFMFEFNYISASALSKPLSLYNWMSKTACVYGIICVSSFPAPKRKEPAWTAHAVSIISRVQGPSKRSYIMPSLPPFLPVGAESQPKHIINKRGHHRPLHSRNLTNRFGAQNRKLLKVNRRSNKLQAGAKKPLICLSFNRKIWACLRHQEAMRNVVLISNCKITKVMSPVI